MPTYRYQCAKCAGEFEIWQSIKDEAMTAHPDCGGSVKKVYLTLMTNGIGTHGEQYQEVEAREARWHKDMPAYKRFRQKGYQPPQIDGCDRLEAVAENSIAINTGNKIKVDEDRYYESKLLAEDIMAGRKTMGEGF